MNRAAPLADRSSCRTRPPAWSGLVAALVATVSVAPVGRAQAQPPPEGAAGTALRRFAVVASSNDGGKERARLRFADSDGRAMADVLTTLGGVSRADLILLPNASRTGLSQAFEKVGAAMAAARPDPRAGRAPLRTHLVVYYSGHSDEQGLLLGGERVSYRELRGWIDAAHADVRIAILDSCASGALIRLKGIKKGIPSFLQDRSNDARGHAFLTASSADEAAQESDRIGAAFFTHYLLSGLRGAADRSRDGLVTLAEAYDFAYEETLHRTQGTVAGAQHPAYDWQLAGTGSVVMTDLKSTDAGLVLDKAIAGRLYVRDEQGRLLAELRKEPVYPVELGLPPGRYRIVLDADGRPYQARATLVAGQRTRIGPSAFEDLPQMVATTRGDTPAVAAAAPELVSAEIGGPTAYRYVPFDAVLAPGIRASGGREPVLNNFVLGIVAHSDALRGSQLSLGGNIVEDSMRGIQISVGMNLLRGPGEGAQITSGANVAQDGFRGAQIANLANVTLGDFRGVQIGIGNWLGGPSRGGQIGVANFAGADHRGAQIGVANVTRHELRGPQIGVIGLAGSLRGPQIGVVNIGGSVDGLQLGVVNIGGRVRGLQIGVVNIGDSVEGASLGIVSLIRDGYHQLSLWSSDLFLSNVGIKLGSKHVYTVFGFGLGRHEDRAFYGALAGLGAHLVPLGGRLFFDIDAVTSSYGTSSSWDDQDGVLSTLRFAVGFQVTRHLSVLAGPTYNVDVRRRLASETRPRPGLGWLESVSYSQTWEIRRFPGFVAGLQAGF